MQALCMRRSLATVWVLAALTSLAMCAGICNADPAAYMNGIAAVITALAYLSERRNTSAAVKELDKRVTVLEKT